MRALRSRRTERLNRALHELRRPLQALVLLEGSGGQLSPTHPEATRRGLLELALAALAQLDQAVNGTAMAVPARRVSCRELIHAALERCRAAFEDSEVRLFWDAGPAYVSGDPAGIAGALDNLLVNALEHGCPRVVVTGAEIAGRLRITVANRVERENSRNGANPRHGHGIPVVSEVAKAHGGRFALYRSSDGCVAALELPLADRAAALAA